MKSLTLFSIVFGVFAFMSCASPQPPAPQQTTTNIPVETTQPTQTIQEIVAQSVDQAFRNIDRSSRIALVNFATANPEISDALLRVLEHTLVERGFIVVDRSELDRIRAEQNLQLSGDVDDNTAVSIGRFVGADVIVTGAVDALRQIGIRILNTQTAIVVGTSLMPLPSGINIEPARPVAQRPAQTTTQTTPQTTTPAQTPSQTTPAQTQTTTQTTPQPTTPSTQTPSQTTPTQATTSYTVAQIITFGQYRWRVLEVSGNRALIITEAVITSRRFGNTNVWANSEIRTWLNGDFYNSFSAADRAKIVQTDIPNPLVQHGVVPGPGTSDRIFLLSNQEAERYFLSNQDRSARNTSGNVSAWWLRSPGDDTSRASIVGSDGSIIMYGTYVYYTGGVRPALWLNL